MYMPYLKYEYQNNVASVDHFAKIASIPIFNCVTLRSLSEHKKPEIECMCQIFLQIC